MHKIFEDMIGNNVIKLSESITESDLDILKNEENNRLILNDGDLNPF